MSCLRAVSAARIRVGDSYAKEGGSTNDLLAVDGERGASVEHEVELLLARPRVVDELVGAVSARVPRQNSPAYAASKWGLDGLTRNLTTGEIGLHAVHEGRPDVEAVAREGDGRPVALPGVPADPARGNTRQLLRGSERIHRGKVRDVYAIDADSLLIVADSLRPVSRIDPIVPGLAAMFSVPVLPTCMSPWPVSSAPLRSADSSR